MHKASTSAPDSKGVIAGAIAAVPPVAAPVALMVYGRPSAAYSRIVDHGMHAKCAGAMDPAVVVVMLVSGAAATGCCP